MSRFALNVTPNHLDRYDFFTDYAAAKHRLFMNQTAEDVAILNADDEITASWASGLKANVVLFSASKKNWKKVCFCAGAIWFAAQTARKKF